MRRTMVQKSSRPSYVSGKLGSMAGAWRSLPMRFLVSICCALSRLEKDELENMMRELENMVCNGVVDS